MSSADAARSEQMRERARERWRQQGDPVLSRAVATVAERPEDLTPAQRAELEAAISDGENADD
jgi:hypothetical protein